MFTGSSIAAIAIPVLFIILDIYFVITLSFPRDERNQIIVWKAASFTLMGVFGAYLIKVIVRMVNGESLSYNLLVILETIAIVYFFALMYYKRKHSA